MSINRWIYNKDALCREFIVDFQAAFDWPLGQIGKIKQKYQKSKSTTVRSKSDENISEAPRNRLKRRSSERHGKSRKVAFEDPHATPWWNYPMRLMKNATNSSTNSNITAKKRRRRHYTDPESRKRAQNVVLHNIFDKLTLVNYQYHYKIWNTQCFILSLTFLLTFDFNLCRW